MNGLPKSSAITVQIRWGGRYYDLGAIRTTSRGAATLPAFTSTRAGTYLVKLSPAAGAARYVKADFRQR